MNVLCYFRSTLESYVTMNAAMLWFCAYVASVVMRSPNVIFAHEYENNKPMHVSCYYFLLIVRTLVESRMNYPVICVYVDDL